MNITKVTQNDCHTEFYSKARFYDIAFSFKNVPEENQTIIDLYRKHSGNDAKSFLDIAAGPASNAIQMAQRGLKSFALDYSKEMVAYGLEKARAAGVSLTYLQGDMRSFDFTETVDLAAIFMDSTSYLITNEDVVTHFKTVAKCLNKNGLYFLEMSHPRDVFSVGKSTITEWTERDGDVEVSVQWGNDTDVFDSIKQSTNVTAKLKYKTPSKQGEIVDQSNQRCFTFNEIDALVKLSGCFEMIDVVGSLKPGVPFSNEKSSWRMIPILKRI
ncbi:MAG: class I SAM-dependent methyltransferase [Oligoflexia bacterium]|nr:class I SAM-dependent methyltransferase [Oligoflexia bacterium]